MFRVEEFIFDEVNYMYYICLISWEDNGNWFNFAFQIIFKSRIAESITTNITLHPWEMSVKVVMPPPRENYGKMQSKLWKSSFFRTTGPCSVKLEWNLKNASHYAIHITNQNSSSFQVHATTSAHTFVFVAKRHGVNYNLKWTPLYYIGNKIHRGNTSEDHTVYIAKGKAESCKTEFGLLIRQFCLTDEYDNFYLRLWCKVIIITTTRNTYHQVLSYHRLYFKVATKTHQHHQIKTKV